MNYNTTFLARPPSSSLHLPPTLISLEEWALVTLSGPDVLKYLQGQVTVDVDRLKLNKHVLCGHCDVNGKMWSTLRIFYREVGLSYLVRRSVLNNQLEKFKMYSVFSKVTISANDDVVLLGIAGFQARKILENVFSRIPNSTDQVMQDEGVTLLHFTDPTERFLLVATAPAAEKLIASIHTKVKLHDSRQWLTLDIEAGYPIIDIENTGKLIPQAANLQALEGISFDKGCYTGQEIVARAKFHGSNKRSLYWLEGHSSRIPKAAEHLELQFGQYWRRTGIILAASTLSNGQLWIQAVINNNLNSKSNLRVCSDDKRNLVIKSLPYKL